jgi:predicted nucleic acid-binding protein
MLRFIRPFFDSNVLLYLLTENDARAAVAEDLLAKSGCISVQVLNEFASVASRKFGKSWSEIGEKLADLRLLCEPVRPLTLATHEAALRIARRYQLNMFDALILASAIEGGCDVVYSEDMQDGQMIEGVTIRNPFGASLPHS